MLKVFALGKPSSGRGSTRKGFVVLLFFYHILLKWNFKKFKVDLQCDLIFQQTDIFLHLPRLKTLQDPLKTVLRAHTFSLIAKAYI